MGTEIREDRGKYTGISVTLDVADDKTGETITINQDAQEAIDSIDESIEACYELLACVEM